MTLQEIIENLKDRRHRLRITQQDLSELSGVSLRTIKAVEKGEANPTMGLLSRLLEPLGLTIEITERVRNE